MPNFLEQLFSEPIHAWKERAMLRAAQMAETFALDDVTVSDIDRIARDIAGDSTRFEVATLRNDEKRGKRRVEREVIDNGLRGGIAVENSYIDIYIPFDGYPKSFMIAPSHSNIIQERIGFEGHALIISLRDDDSLEALLASAIQRIEGNLERLRSEISSINTSVVETVKSIISKRLVVREEQRQRDKGRSFPID